MNWNDPQMSQLLLSLGGRLLANSTNPNPAAGFGQAVLGGLGDYATIRNQAMQQKLTQQQIERQEREAELAAQQQKQMEESQARMADIIRQGLGGRGMMYQPQALGMPSGAIGMPGQPSQVAGDMYMPAAGYQEITPEQAQPQGMMPALTEEALRQSAMSGSAGGTLKAIQSMLAPKGEAFTLSPGQKRYDAYGNEIAAAPEDVSKVGSEQFKQEKELRGEFRNLTKDFGLINDSFGRIVASSKDPSPAGDMGLIFSFMKMLDPNSTVREGEYATAQNAGSVPQSIMATYNSIVNGQKLTPAQRNDFVSRSARFYEQANTIYQDQVSQYTLLSERAGLDPEDVILKRDYFKSKDYMKNLPPLPKGFKVIE